MTTDSSRTETATDRRSHSGVNAALQVMKYGAAVWGTDGKLGPMLAVVVDPATKSATEIAVRNGDIANTGRLIPVGFVTAATPEHINVSLDRHQFFDLDRFMVPYHSHADGADILAHGASAWSDLWLIRPSRYQFAVHENVPSGDVAIRRGVSVFDSTGHRAGSVEGWNFHPETGQLVSLVFTAHTLLQRHNILVDASSIASIDDDGVRLTLSAADLRQLQSKTKQSP